MQNITEQDWIILKKEAQNVINNTNIKDMNDIEYAMFGASLAILKNNTLQNVVDVLPESNINEDIDEMKYVIVEFWRSYDLFENTRTQENKDKMLKYLKNLLLLFEKTIVELRHKIQHPEGIEMLKQFYINLSNKI